MPIINLLLLLLHSSKVATIINSGEVATIPIVQKVTQVVVHNHGDVIGEYKLEQRLDYLGTSGSFFDTNFKGRNLLIAPGKYELGTSAPGMGQSTSFGYLTLLNEIRLDVNASCIRNGTYCLDQHIFRGGHGEIWRARRISKDGVIDNNSSFILKRMHVKDKPDILRCALREIHFGRKLSGVISVARFVSYFNTESDYWLVFHDEGVSLQKLLYSITMSDVSAIMEPSLLWRRLRTSKGASSLRGIMQQIVASVATLHFKGITHRDVKPSNILLNTEAEARILMADLSSAVNTESISNGLYGSLGPIVAEETIQYAPPEVLLSLYSEGEIPYDAQHPTSYDSWSVGVVFLEMILGTSDVFTVDQRTAAMIAHRMKRSAGISSEEASKAMLLAALADYCIYQRIDNHSDAHEVAQQGQTIKYDGDEKLTATVNAGEVNLKCLDFPSPSIAANSSKHTCDLTTRNVIAELQSKKKGRASDPDSILHQYLQPMARQSRRCGLEDLRQAILRRDPLGTGLTDRWGLDLLSRLLQWEPSKRMRMADALDHAYFTGPHISPVDGSHHATRDDAQNHLLDRNYPPSVTISTGPKNQQENIERNTVKPDYENHLLMNIEASDRIIQKASDRNDEDKEVVVDDNTGSFWVTPDLATKLNFTCPQCGRTFLGDWAGCHNHLKTRKHGKRCTYSSSDKSSSKGSSGDGSSEVLPSCLSEHSMLPIDEHSGWCELQGRKRYMEDMHSVAFEETYKLFAVYDGHSGSKAALFSSKRLHALFNLYLTSEGKSTSNSSDGMLQDFGRLRQADQLSRINHELIDPESLSFNLLKHIHNSNPISPIAEEHELLIDTEFNALVTESASTLNSTQCTIINAEIRPDVRHANRSDDDLVPGRHMGLSGTSPRITVGQGMTAMRDAFLQTDTDLESTIAQHDPSGTTASVAVLFKDHLLVANVGDSRVVLCCSTTYRTMNKNNIRISLPLQITVDHTPYDSSERLAVERRGGKILRDGVLRVNGKLAVTRSLGDFTLKKYLSSEPDIIVLRLRSSTSILFEENTKDMKPDGNCSSRSNCDTSSNSASKKRQGFNLTDIPPAHTQSISSTTTPIETREKGPKLITSDNEKEGAIRQPEYSYCSRYQTEIRKLCGMYDWTASSESSPSSSYLEPLFLILASDGLWDFLSGTDATELVCEFFLMQISSRQNTYLNFNEKINGSSSNEGKLNEGNGKKEENLHYKTQYRENSQGDGDERNSAHDKRKISEGREGKCQGSILQHSALHDAARLLAIEAYVRGSMDNVGVCVVDLLPYL